MAPATSTVVYAACGLLNSDRLSISICSMFMVDVRVGEEIRVNCCQTLSNTCREGAHEK